MTQCGEVYRRKKDGSWVDKFVSWVSHGRVSVRYGKETRFGRF